MRLLAGLLVLLLGAACGTAGASPDRTVTVLAASSLTGVFTELAHSYEAGHDGVDVRLSFGGSSSLARQAVQGVPAGVFAAADEETMRQAVDGGAVSGQPQVFATNVLEIAVPAGNPAHIRSLADLARPSVKVALCATEVPCGALAQRLLDAKGVRVQPVTRETNVKATLAKVTLGEVDAALVYRTDVRAAGSQVEGVPVPGAERFPNRYEIALLDAATDPSDARGFRDLVLGADGQRALQRAGFGTP